jgi:DNA repair protein RadC
LAKAECTAAVPRLHIQQGQLTLSIPVDEEAVIASAQRILKQRFKRLSQPLESPQALRTFLQMQFLPCEQEVFACLFLDSQHQLITMETMFYGSINQAKVYPREVVKAALKHNCAALVALHNHPSGHAEPSQADLSLTFRLHEALQMVEIELLDHFIVGADCMISLAERGHL